MKSRVEVKLDKLLEAYLWMCSSLEETNQAVINRHTGEVVWRGVDNIWQEPVDRSDLEIMSFDEESDDLMSVWILVYQVLQEEGIVKILRMWTHYE